MRSFLINFWVILLLLLASSNVMATKTVLLTPSPTPVPTPVDSYQLFWPLSAGKTASDSLYFLKFFKESLRGWFIFGNYNKAEYNITLSEKRLLEAEKLLMKNDYQNAKKTLDFGKSKVEEALSFTQKAADLKSVNMSILKTKFMMSIDKQKILLNYLITQLSDDQKGSLSEYINYLDSVKTKLAQIE
ncbi:hypothetical protein HY404_01110 [Candidatus Microgenomates bacterium]|nr:hypothetical protein [Candidatus Microgenomates bacterium]